MQVPAPFEYERATSVDHALELLQRLGPEARLLAGGHSLLPMMKLRLAAPEHLIDIDALAGELGYIREHEGEVRIGAMTRHRELLESELLAARLPIFTDAERVIADPVVRNRGTIGGALCQADPAEDLSAVCAAVDARMVIRGPDGERRCRYARVPPRTVPRPPSAANEMLIEVRVPLRPGSGSAYEKVDRRVGDWAVAAAGASVTRDRRDDRRGPASRSPRSARVSPRREAERALIGKQPSDELFNEAARLAAGACSPITDQRGSAEYKRHVAGVLTQRALRSAHRARTEGAGVMQVTVSVNGREHTRDVEPRMLLVHFLRDELGLTGTHWGCDTSNCGTCVVLMDGEPVKSCTVLAATAAGHEIRTVEGLEVDGVLDPVQQGFTEEHGLQCGFCTPGMMLTARALLDRNAESHRRREIREAISGQICRCTGYSTIVRSIRWAAEHPDGQATT